LLPPLKVKNQLYIPVEEYGLQPGFTPCLVVSTFQRGRIDPNLRNARVFWVHGSDALYQGTTLVGPLKANKDLGFSPCAFFSAQVGVPVLFERVLSYRCAMHFVQDVPFRG
jgi:hypothetical protein